MAGGIDWFRWHHGSVTDPKFQLIAKKAGGRVGDVIAVWAALLENGSANGASVADFDLRPATNCSDSSAGVRMRLAQSLRNGDSSSMGASPTQGATSLA